MFLDEATIGPVETDIAIGSPLDAEPAFVYQPVMMTAQQNEVVDRGVTAIRPVTDVMRIDEAVMAAAREPAATVARLQGPAQCRRYGPGLAADIEWIARFILRYP